MSLVGRWNYHNELTSQFPLAGLRVVYAKAGSRPAACLLRDGSAVIDHMLYWTAPAGEGEAQFLTAVLNSETARGRAEQFQARGQFGARHFDKVIFNLPIPRFDEDSQLHLTLANAAAEAERIAALVELPDAIPFQRARAVIRTALSEAGLAQRIDALVSTLLDGP
jgi:hypothetical protein